MEFRTLIGPLALVVSFALGCADPASFDGERAPLVGGAVEVGYTSVGAVVVDLGVPGTRLCSGTKIADGWVLTSGTCVHDVVAADIEFVVGADIFDPAAEFHPVQAVHLHPTFVPPTMGLAETDVALLEIAGLSALPAAIPNSGDIYDQDGNPIVWVGYGYLSVAPETGAGVRRSADGTIIAVDFTRIYYSYAGTLPCGPDRGGATFRDFGGEVRLIGVISSMDESCAVSSVDTRVDYVYPWIDSVVSMGPTDGGVTDAGPSDGGHIPPQDASPAPPPKVPVDNACDCHAAPGHGALGHGAPLAPFAGALLLLAAAVRARRRSQRRRL